MINLNSFLSWLQTTWYQNPHGFSSGEKAAINRGLYFVDFMLHFSQKP